MMPTSSTYPPAERLDLVEQIHGTPIADPYRWLEDPADARTVRWSAAQHTLFQRTAATWPATTAIAGTVRALLRTGWVAPPTWRGGRAFVTRREPDAEHPVLTVMDADTAGADDAGRDGGRILLDPMALDPTGATTLDSWSPSREGDLVAVQLSERGTEDSALRVLDVASGEVVDGPIDRTRFSAVAWLPRAADGSIRFYYVRRLPPEDVPDGEAQYHRRVYLHTVGSPAETDVLIFGQGRSKTTYFGVWTRSDGRWLVVSAAAGTAPRNDVWLADLGAGDAASPALVEVVAGQDARHSVWVGHDDRLYAWTDSGAPRGRLRVGDPARPQVEHWRDLLAEDPEAVLADVAVLDRHPGDCAVLAVARTRHGVSELSLYDRDGTRLTGVALPGVGTVGGLHTRPGGGSEAWLSYTDGATPSRVLHLDVADPVADPVPELRLWSLPPGRPPAGPAVTSQQLSCTSPDGTMVRMVVLARSDALDAAGRPLQPAPAVLYGYGGFGMGLSPGYSATATAWVRAGGVWVDAQLRGGDEEGEEWHRAGMMAAKQNVFDDFHSVADALVARGWTTPGQLGCYGGSNGGLLVGAALTQRPQSFAAVVCSAPLLDMVRYELHGLGVSWNEEYGTAADPEQLRWLLGYSPYHRVVPGTGYPAVLFTVFGSDSRVDPLHARKMCAALQHATTSSPERSPVLIRAETDVGHGQRSVSKSVTLTADVLSFLARHTGLTWPA